MRAVQQPPGDTFPDHQHGWGSFITGWVNDQEGVSVRSTGEAPPASIQPWNTECWHILTVIMKSRELSEFRTSSTPPETPGLLHSWPTADGSFLTDSQKGWNLRSPPAGSLSSHLLNHFILSRVMGSVHNGWRQVPPGWVARLLQSPPSINLYFFLAWAGK